MEDKIEVNEYVRTKDGVIDKVIIEYDGKCNNPNCSEKHISCKYNYYNEKDIVKHSKQLIDLIEVEDYVNGSKVLAVMEDMKTGELHLEMTSNYTNEEIGDCTIYDKDIKTILTKEQFEANCYKVGGEDGI